MQQLWIILLSVFAALGITAVILWVSDWIVLGSRSEIGQVRLTVQVRGGAGLPYALWRLIERADCGSGMSVVLLDEGLDEADREILARILPDAEIVRGDGDAGRENQPAGNCYGGDL